MNNLRAARRAAGLTQAEVAQKIGITQNGYSYWETAKNKIDHESLVKLADLFGVSTDYLLGLGANAVGRQAVKIPVLGDVAAGIPIEAVEDIVDYEEIDQALAATGEFFGLRIKGASMEPRMREGDVVIVRKQDTAETGDTAVVLVNGDSATVKKIKRTLDGITLLPTNPAYDHMFFSNAEISSLPIRILGRVVELRAKY